MRHSKSRGLDKADSCGPGVLAGATGAGERLGRSGESLSVKGECDIPFGIDKPPEGDVAFLLGLPTVLLAQLQMRQRMKGLSDWNKAKGLATEALTVSWSLYLGPTSSLSLRPSSPKAS